MAQQKPEVDPRDVRIKKLEADRDYLWRALARLEGWASTAPAEALPRVADMIRVELDGFRPVLPAARAMPEDE